MVQVVSIQRSTRSIAAADGTSFVIPLGTEVEIGAAIVHHTTSIPAGTSRDFRHIITMELEASGSASAGKYDQIRVRRNSSASAVTFTTAWEVVEFDPATLGSNGVSWGRDSGFSAGGTLNKTIAITDTASAVCLLAWSTSSFVHAFNDGSVRASITSTTNLDLICSAGKAGTIEVLWQVIDFDPADVAVQRGPISVTGNSGTTGNSNTATISAVDTAASLLIGNGFNFPTFGSSSVSRYAVGLQLTNSTTVTAYIGGYGSDSGKTVTLGYEVAEFLDGAAVQAGVFAFGTGDTTKTTSTFSPTLDPANTSVWPVAPNLGNVDPKNTNPGQTTHVSFYYTPDITTNIDSVTGTRAATGSIAVDSWWQVITFSTGTTDATVDATLDTLSLTEQATAIVQRPVAGQESGTVSEQGGSIIVRAAAPQEALTLAEQASVIAVRVAPAQDPVTLTEYVTDVSTATGVVDAGLEALTLAEGGVGILRGVAPAQESVVAAEQGHAIVLRVAAPAESGSVAEQAAVIMQRLAPAADPLALAEQPTYQPLSGVVTATCDVLTLAEQPCTIIAVAAQAGGGPDRQLPDHEPEEFDAYLAASARFVRQQAPKPAKEKPLPVAKSREVSRPVAESREPSPAVATVAPVADQLAARRALEEAAREATIAALRREQRRLKAIVLLLAAA